MNDNFSEKVNANSHALKILRSKGHALPPGGGGFLSVGATQLSIDFSETAELSELLWS